MKTVENLNKFLSEALAIEALAAKEAGTIGYTARNLVQATLPHKQTKGNLFTRKNGTFTLSIATTIPDGLPYGSIPRLLISWVATEAVKTKDRTLILGNNLSSFMEELGLGRHGGPRGDITRLRNQAIRLFSCFISCTYTDNNLTDIKNLLIADNVKLWWTPKDPNQIDLIKSTVTLSQPFYEELVNNPVPIDMRALKALKQSPMAIDIYSWLTYRMSYLRKPTVIPWEALQMQFGAEYGLTRSFKAAFLTQLKKVCIVYPEVNVADHSSGLLLKPSSPHIKILSS